MISDFIKKSDTDVIPWFPQNDGEKAFDVIEQDEAINKSYRGYSWPRMEVSLLHGYVF